MRRIFVCTLAFCGGHTIAFWFLILEREATRLARSFLDGADEKKESFIP